MRKVTKDDKSKILKNAWAAFKRAKGYAARFNKACKSFDHYLSLAWSGYKRDFLSPEEDINNLNFAML